MGAELDCRYAARPRHTRRDSAGESCDSDFDAGGIIGCLCLPFIADRWGRKGALFVYFLGALLSVPTTFMLATEFSHAVLASPIMGFFAAGVTAGFAIYFPELFPTAIRATAQGFCFNFARFFCRRRPAPSRSAHCRPRLFRSGHRHHRLDLFRGIDHSHLRAGN